MRRGGDVRLMLVGIGHVGRALLSAWSRLRPWARLVAAADSRGLFIEKARRGTAGLRPKAVLARKASGDYDRVRRRGATTAAWIEELQPDILVELSASNLDHGEPALPDILAGLGCGAHVVTSAKSHHASPRHWRSIERAIAKAGGRQLFLDHASMLAGIPATEMAAGAGFEVSELEGVLNGTTNFILGRLEEGAEFDEALGEAQSRGYTEKDPSYDLEGHDVAMKLSGLARVFLGKPLSRGDVKLSGMTRGRRGIVGIDGRRVRELAEQGHRIKLVGRVERGAGRIRASVGPRILPREDRYAGIGGFMNAIRLRGTMNATPMELFLTGPGAGADETASRVLGNLNELLDRLAWRERS